MYWHAVLAYSIVKVLEDILRSTIVQTDKRMDAQEFHIHFNQFMSVSHKH